MKPVLKRCLKPEVDEIILDGEMMVWNTVTGDFAAFGENRSLNNFQRQKAEGFQACYIVFDCVWHNGRAIDKLPLRERREILEPLVNWEKTSMELSEIHIIEPNKPNTPHYDPGRPESKNHTEEVICCHVAHTACRTATRPHSRGGRQHPPL